MHNVEAVVPSLLQSARLVPTSSYLASLVDRTVPDSLTVCWPSACLPCLLAPSQRWWCRRCRRLLFMCSSSQAILCLGTVYLAETERLYCGDTRMRQEATESHRKIVIIYLLTKRLHIRAPFLSLQLLCQLAKA